MCGTCTFVNRSVFPSCEVCEARRPYGPSIPLAKGAGAGDGPGVLRRGASGRGKSIPDGFVSVTNVAADGALTLRNPFGVLIEYTVVVDLKLCFVPKAVFPLLQVGHRYVLS